MRLQVGCRCGVEGLDRGGRVGQSRAETGGVGPRRATRFSVTRRGIVVTLLPGPRRILPICHVSRSWRPGSGPTSSPSRSIKPPRHSRKRSCTGLPRRPGGRRSRSPPIWWRDWQGAASRSCGVRERCGAPGAVNTAGTRGVATESRVLALEALSLGRVEQSCPSPPVSARLCPTLPDPARPCPSPCQPRSRIDLPNPLEDLPPPLDAADVLPVALQRRRIEAQRRIATRP